MCIVTGKVNLSYDEDYTKGFNIYLHEKGQFWPGLEMDRIGQKKIQIPINAELWGTFTSMHKISLDKKSDPCMSDPGYSYTMCIKDYVTSKAGCHLDWADNNGYNNRDSETCISKNQVQSKITKKLSSFYFCV